MHKDGSNFIFLDADNFLYRGLFDIGQQIYGELHWRIQHGWGLQETPSIPSKQDLADGAAFFLRTTHLPEPQHVDALLMHLQAQGFNVDPTRERYHAFVEQRFEALFSAHIRLLDGTEKFLQAIEKKRSEGYDIRLHIISHALESVVEKSTRFLGIRDYFNSVHGMRWDDPQGGTKADTIVRIAGASENNFVVMGGDAISDVAAAHQATARGVCTHAFATPTGQHTAAQLHAAGAHLIVPTLESVETVFQWFDQIATTIAAV